MPMKPVNQGMLDSAVPGRTDKLPIAVPAGAYVIPADIVSGLGQGNSKAGAYVINKMFRRPTARALRYRRAVGMNPTEFADGGMAGEQHVPIIAAGGEYILSADSVRDIGGVKISSLVRYEKFFILEGRQTLFLQCVMR